MKRTISFYRTPTKKDKYAVIYVRNDTAELERRQVQEPRILLENLYPGAGYHIKVFAVSHGLWSEPHTHFQAVCESSFSFFFLAHEI